MTVESRYWCITGMLMPNLLYVHVCTYVHVYIRVYMRVCVYVCTCVHVYMRTYVYVCMCAHVCTCVHAYVCVCVYVCTCVHMYKCVCAYVCVCVYTCVNVQTFPALLQHFREPHVPPQMIAPLLIRCIITEGKTCNETVHIITATY